MIKSFTRARTNHKTKPNLDILYLIKNTRIDQINLFFLINCSKKRFFIYAKKIIKTNT